jgi:signal transduction histidine kinase
MLRPLPDLDDAAAMAKLGRLSAIRNARLDALHEMRDAFTRLQSANSDDAEEIANLKAALARLEEVVGIGQHL